MTHPTYPLRQLLLDDYRIDGIEQVMTPALAIYPDYVDNNISATLRLVGGDVNRFRPHVKTAKLGAVMAQYVARGVRQFKCATSLELTTLMDVGAEDVCLAFPLVGAGARRLRALAGEYPQARISTLVEAKEQLAPYAGSKVGVFLDINPGMNRTGLEQARLDDALAVGRAAVDQGIAFRGLHYYDGHLAKHAMPERTRLAHAGYDVLMRIAHAFVRAGLPVGELITSGTPAFPCAASYAPFAAGGDFVHRLSPGTIVYYDTNCYDALLDAYGYRPAAVVVSSVISHPTPQRYTCDAGHKSLAADAGVPTGYPIGRPDDQPAAPSEEHLPVDASNLPPLGSTVYWVPKHVCPTINMFDAALMVRGGRIVGVEPVTARGHELPMVEHR